MENAGFRSHVSYWKAGKLMNVISFQICLCGVPYCCPGTCFKDLLDCVQDWIDHWAEQVCLKIRVGWPQE